MNPKQRVNQLSKTHIGWRPDPELKARWHRFLKTHPPFPLTQYLDAVLTHYLDQAERYDIDPMTLRPRPKK